MTPFFLPAASGRLFTLHFPAGSGDGRCIVVAPPLFEELNKSRGMIADQCRSLADAGFDVVWSDLFGTGDSEGEVAHASVAAWRDDMDAVTSWCGDRGLLPWALLTVRAGALLVDQVAERFSTLLAWQPVLRGDALVAQLFRLRTASAMGEQNRVSRAELEQQLADAGSMTFGGYRLTAGLVGELRETRLAPPAASPTTIFEVRAAGELTPSTPYSRFADAARAAAKAEVDVQVVRGTQFWSTQEISTAPALIEATTRRASMGGRDPQ